MPPLTCTHGNWLSSSRGVIDIIWGDVFVVSARFLATAVVTLRCNRVSDMSASFYLLEPTVCWPLPLRRLAVQAGRLHHKKS